MQPRQLSKDTFIDFTKELSEADSALLKEFFFNNPNGIFEKEKQYALDPDNPRDNRSIKFSNEIVLRKFPNTQYWEVRGKLLNTNTAYDEYQLIKTLKINAQRKLISTTEQTILREYNAIDFDDLSEEQGRALFELFQPCTPYQHNYFAKGPQAFVSNGIKHYFNLPASLMWRESKRYPDNREEDSAEIFIESTVNAPAPIEGSGAFKDVYKNKGTLKKRDGFLEKKDSERVVKVSKPATKTFIPDQRFIQDEMNSYEIAKDLPLGLKKPISFPYMNGKYTLIQAERYIPKEDLISYFQRVRAEQKKISWDFYLYLCLELLYSLKEQFQDFDVITRDVKLDNVRLSVPDILDEFTLPQISAKHIDIGFARNINHADDFRRCGTADYMAPEILCKNGSDLSTDIYQLGLLFYHILGGPQLNCQNPDGTVNISNVLNRIKERQFDEVARGLPAIDRNVLIAIIKRMIAYEKQDRSIQEDFTFILEQNKKAVLNAIDDFEKLIWNRKLRAQKSVDIKCQMIIAHHKAVKVKNEMPELLFQRKHFRLKQLIEDSLKDIEDHPSALAEFERVLRIRALYGMKTKQELLAKVEGIVGDHEYCLSRLRDVEYKAKKYKITFALNTDVTKNCDSILQKIAATKARYNEYPLNLDSLVILNEKFAKEAKKLEKQIKQLKRNKEEYGPKQKHKWQLSQSFFALNANENSNDKPSVATEKKIQSFK